MRFHAVKRWHPSLKILIAVLILLVPPAIIILLLKPVVPQQSASKKYDVYRLKADFQKADLADVLFRLQDDDEFLFYFRSLSDQITQQAVDEIYADVATRKSAAGIMAAIEEHQSRVQNMAEIINGLEFSGQMDTSPDGLNLLSLLWHFLYEDFKCMSLGAVYKSTYDRDFRFQWDPQTRSAAAVLRQSLAHFPEQQRQIFAEKFLLQSN